jgi:hypothetical protein
MKRLRVLAVAGAFALGHAAFGQTWDFEVRLDGKPIGSHRFVVSGPAAAREVASTARFDVRLLGIPLYRYRHEAQERWQGDCLRSLKSRTDDDGKPAQVDEQRAAAADCLMSFAYWHPALPRQTRLLNPQTGQVEDVRFERLPAAPLQVQGREVEAARWRLVATTPASQQVLTLWLDPADQRWIGLDAQVRGRLLTYRLP